RAPVKAGVGSLGAVPRTVAARGGHLGRGEQNAITSRCCAPSGALWPDPGMWGLRVINTGADPGAAPGTGLIPCGVSADTGDGGDVCHGDGEGFAEDVLICRHLCAWSGRKGSSFRSPVCHARALTTLARSQPGAIPGVLYNPVLDHTNYIVGAGEDTRVALGALLEVLLIVANVGTAVVLFPVLKRQDEGLALGYVAARLVECTFIAIGIVSLLAVVTLRQDFAEAAGGDSGSFVTVGQSLVAIHDWTFLLGPGFVVGVGNGLILGYLMYRSGLVPRGMAMLGLVGGPLLCAAGIAVLFDVIEPGSATQAIATIPEFVWELSLGIYLMVKGFKPAPILSGTIGDAGVGTSSSPT
ncbi:MAG: DUF4386 domain-containing protein, partial [Nocardioidaceae bacterium]